jgi:hypothetical protein
MDFDMLITKGRKKLNKIKIGDQFVLKDLYAGIEWNDLSKGERMMLGKVFKNKVNDGIIPNVVCVGKADNNSTMYKKNS